MRHKFIQLLTLVILISWIGCSDDDLEENSQLKASLQGTWKRFLEPSMWTQVTFNDHTVTWYDSTISMFSDLEGEIQTERGKGEVEFTINDGHIGYKFNGVEETDVLWIPFDKAENSTIVNYKIENGIVSGGESFRTSQPIGPRYFSTCFVIFSDDRRTVEFCDGNGVMTAIDCIRYNKVN